MSLKEYRMTEEERRAFRAYIVPDPVCVEGQRDRDMPASREMRERLAANDTFIIRGMDRLEHSGAKDEKRREVVEQAKKFNIAILDIPILNSRSGASNELMRYIISDVLLQLHACIDRGKTERLREKVAEGVRAAKEKGVRIGRRPKKRPEEFADLREKWLRREISGEKAAEKLGISRPTFYRWVKE